MWTFGHIQVQAIIPLTNIESVENEQESCKEKRERKQENLENKTNFFRIVIPTLVVLCAVVIGLVYMGTRQKQILEP